MATRTLKATGPGDWGDPTAWEEGAVPVNGDDVYLNQGNQSITAGFDQSLVALASLNVGPGYSGSIGGGGNVLTFDEITTLFFSGQGTQNYLSTTDAVKGIGSAYIIGSSSAADALHLDGVVLTLHITKGKVTIDAAADVAALYVTPSSQGDVALTITAGATLSGAIYILNGTVTCAVAGTLVNLFAGSWTQIGTAGATGICVYGGTMTYNSTGAINSLMVYPTGYFNAANNKGPLTITGAVLHANGTIDIANGCANIDFGANKLRIMGAGTLKVDPGRVIDVT